jgi:hypothetical protein
MYINEIREALERVNIHQAAVESIVETSEEYLHLNKNQLWAGKKASGADITPSYLDDPFFKTRKQAEAYASWKQRITPNPERNKYAPNLYINGFFYESLQIAVGVDITFTGWPEVLQKYDDIYGLTPEHQPGYNFDVFLPVFANKLSEQTGFVFN